MRTFEWIALAALTMLVVEGFALSVFPRQVQETLSRCDPRLLQNVGLCEAAIGAALILMLLMG